MQHRRYVPPPGDTPVVVINQRMSLETYEERLFDAQISFERYPVRSGQIDIDDLDKAAKMIACGRLLTREPGKHLWPHFACRQAGVCGTCARRRQTLVAKNFMIRLLALQKATYCWGTVITYKKPVVAADMQESYENAVQILKDMPKALTQYRRNHIKSRRIDGYVAGIHTKLDENGLLWPHIHVLVFGSDDLGPTSSTGFIPYLLNYTGNPTLRTVTQKYGACGVGKTIKPSDLTKMAAYTIRGTEVDDTVVAERLREKLVAGRAERHRYAISRMAGGKPLKGVPWPNHGSLPTNREYWIAHYRKNTVVFDQIPRVGVAQSLVKVQRDISIELLGRYT